ncbi:hypothetical protein ZHAS_00011613 [Anopheles sinensis]|uniref:ANF_receptor domain-containing protein n=1 Tax=Anopheles sinensis TaxID=74873 RepID=A0A084W0P2_ANOSI|nr:hypothetical protein ZHAS_00011613 [Anopheles sinensis]
MLGAVSPDSFDTLHSYSNTFQMPFVTPWFPEKVLTPSSGFLDFAISMRPDYYQAIIDTVRYYGWDRIIYMYDSHDADQNGLSEVWSDRNDMKQAKRFPVACETSKALAPASPSVFGPDWQKNNVPSDANRQHFRAVRIM